MLRFGEVVAPIGQPMQPVDEPGLYWQAAADRQRRLFRQAHPRPRIRRRWRSSRPTRSGWWSMLSAATRSSTRCSSSSRSGTVQVRRIRAFRSSSTRPCAGCSATPASSSWSATSAPQLMAKITAAGRPRGDQASASRWSTSRSGSADLPEANSQAIYQRMQTERQRQATEIRAQGEQAARRIRAEADRQATVIVAEANGESEQLRGEGEAEAQPDLRRGLRQGPGVSSPSTGRCRPTRRA